MGTTGRPFQLHQQTGPPPPQQHPHQQQRGQHQQHQSHHQGGGGGCSSSASTEVISSAIVKYNYQAQQLDELSLVKGSRVLILEKSGDGWWRGQVGHKNGWFPSNYTQEELEDAHTYCMAENVLDIMVALYHFTAQNDTELSFNKGDRLEIMDRPSTDPDWFKARNTQAQVGLVPKNYLVELSQYLTNEVDGGTATTATTTTTSTNDTASSNLADTTTTTHLLPHNEHPGGHHHNHNAPSFSSSSSSNNDIINSSWYFGMISRSECDNLLTEKGIDGDFILRDSETNVR